jgi:hypothetical protein
MSTDEGHDVKKNMNEGHKKIQKNSLDQHWTSKYNTTTRDARPFASSFIVKRITVNLQLR